MLECDLPGESAIRTRWHAAVRLALSKWIKRRGVVDGIMGCWAMTAGRIHTAAGDQSRGWCAPPMVEEADSGLRQLVPGPCRPAAVLRLDDAAIGSGWRRRGRLGR